MRHVAAGPARALVVIALLAGDWHAARAPAIDFARPLPPECAPYAEVVAGIKAMRIYTGAYDRPQRHRAPDSPGGSKLVKPLEERRVNVTGGYEAHFVRARQLLPVEEFFPLDARLRTKVLASDAVAAAEWAVRAERRGTLGAERLARDKAVAQYCGRLRPCSLAILRRDQPPGPATIASKVNVACMAALVDGMGLPDKHAPGHMCHGFPIWNPTNSHSQRAIEPNLTPAQAAAVQAALMADHANITLRAARRVEEAARRAGMSSPQVQGVVNCTDKERAAGLLRGGWTFRQLQQRHPAGSIAMPRFGKPEMKESGMSVRCIDDGPWSGTHGATRFEETAAHPSFTYPALVARAVQREHRRLQPGGGYTAMTVSFYDLKSAYKTVPTSQPHLTVIAVYDPRVPGVRYYDHPGHVFGLGASVVNFQRYPHIIVAAARSLCGWPADHYVDDIMGPDLASAGRTGPDCLKTIVAAMGDDAPPPMGRFVAPRLDPGKDKPPAAVNVGLGVVANLTRMRTHGVAVFEPKPERVAKVLAMWAQGARQGFTESECARLHGKRAFLMETAWGRAGRAAALPLVHCMNAGTGRRHAFTAAFKAAMEFDVALLGGERPRLPPLTVHVGEDVRPPVLVYTDAAFKWRRKRKRECAADERRGGFVPLDAPLPEPWQFDAQLGMVVYDPIDGFFEASEARPDESLVRNYLRRRRKTYIAQMEALAALGPFITHARRLAGRRVVHFIDNTVALSALVHGYVGKEDLAQLVNVYNIMAAALRARTYLDYVPSKDNIADLPSRADYVLTDAMGAARGEMRVPTGDQLDGPLHAWFDAAAAQAPTDASWPV